MGLTWIFPLKKPHIKFWMKYTFLYIGFPIKLWLDKTVLAVLFSGDTFSA